MTNYAERTVAESDMSTLRDRIVRNLGANYGLTDDGYSRDDLGRMADGLIRELQLKPLDEHYNAASTRYVTGWIDNV